MRVTQDEPFVIVDPTTLRLIHRSGRWRRWLWGLVVLIAAIGLATWLWPRGEPPTLEVRRGGIIHSVVAVGQVDAERILEIVPQIRGRIAKVHVAEGDRVEPGQRLVTLESDTLVESHREALYAMEAARARWSEIRRGARAEDLQEARAVVAEAEGRIREAQSRVGAAGVELRYARRSRERQEILLKKGAVSLEAVDEVRKRQETAEAAVAAAEAAVDICTAQLERARAARDSLEKGATEEVREAARAELRRAEATVARLETELKQAEILSPVRAVVLRRYKDPGETAYPEMPRPIVVLGEMPEGGVVRVEVMEGDLHKLKVGQEAELSSDAWPGKRWKGTVAEVSPVMGKKALFTEGPKEKTDVKVLEIRIRLPHPLGLPLKAPVEARLRDVIREDVLILPLRAFEAPDTIRRADGTLARVVTGARDETFVEIISGLSLGERVRVGR